MSTDAAVAAIKFALATDEGLEYLRLWSYGEFDVCRREWPEAPKECYVGADPLMPETIALETAAGLNELDTATLVEQYTAGFAHGLRQRTSVDFAEAQRLRHTISKVCEGWSLPVGARKVLELALFTPTATESVATSSQKELL